MKIDEIESLSQDEINELFEITNESNNIENIAWYCYAYCACPSGGTRYTYVWEGANFAGSYWTNNAACNSSQTSFCKSGCCYNRNANIYFISCS